MKLVTALLIIGLGAATAGICQVVFKYPSEKPEAKSLAPEAGSIRDLRTGEKDEAQEGPIKAGDTYSSDVPTAGVLVAGNGVTAVSSTTPEMVAEMYNFWPTSKADIDELVKSLDVLLYPKAVVSINAVYLSPQAELRQRAAEMDEEYRKMEHAREVVRKWKDRGDVLK